MNATVRLLVVALIAAACATGTTGEQQTTTSTDSTSSSTGAPSTSTTEPGTTSTAPDDTTTTDSGRETAPDFTLQLGEGGSFTLSQGAKPVYLVFWAEW